MIDFIKLIPKAELHLHIEGTFEPELMFKIATKNNFLLKFNTVQEIRQQYKFNNLQSFLDIYYLATQVLIEEQDFFDLAWAYFEKCNEQNIVHSKIFFDPQAHTSRGVPFATIVNGLHRECQKAKKEFNINDYLIMSFLRHLSETDAFKTLAESIPFKDKIIGVGLDSSELNFPLSVFERVFKKAREHGFLPVAHAGEERPPEYIWEAINLLDVVRIDHGVRSEEDYRLIKHLIDKRIPLTICLLSNLKLGVVKSLQEQNVKRLLNLGLCVTINSDDPPILVDT